MWHTQMAAVTGSGHKRQGMPCQDKTWTLTENGITAIALADGAGSARLSHEGAKIAVQTICQTLCDQFDELYCSASPMEMRAAVLKHVRQNIRAYASEQGVATGDLACTLLAVAVRGDEYLVVHIGDGVIGYQKSGKLLVASQPQNGEFANTTIFVTSPEALRNATVLRGYQPQLEGFVLMSDGCEAALYQKKKVSIAPLVGRLFQRSEMLNCCAAEQLLQMALECAVSPRTHDDCSLVVMTRKGETFGFWEKLTQREKADVLGVKTGNRNRRRRAIRKYARIFGVD